MTDKEIEEKAIKNIESLNKNNIKYPFVCRCDMTNNADEECRECKVNAYCSTNLSCEKAKELYNKAIDDFVSRAITKQNELFNNPSVTEQLQFKTFLYVIAEQLKRGVDNESSMDDRL